MERWTESQEHAIEARGKSLLVSAAAGSGKTSVLTERCVRLIESGTGAERLLVVTFTEAAAAEMRSRIEAALRRRAEERPGNAALKRELALLGSAQISTIHAFCLSVLRKWFEEAEVDPAAPVLDADEAALLEAETMDALVRDLYGGDGPLARAFRGLVVDYALGRDDEIRGLVLTVSHFLESLPPSSDWASDALARLESMEPVLDALGREMADEIARVGRHGAAVAAAIEKHRPEGADYGEMLRSFASACEGWIAEIAKGARETAAESIRSFEFPKAKGVRGLDSAAKARRRAAGEAKSRVKALFDARVKRPFALFSAEEDRAALARTLPAARALTDLAREFRRRHGEAKAALGVLDFSDLEQRAARLLLPPGSEIARALRDRFEHVLVDEYQDVNPLQEAILRAVSREDEPDREANLFTVGDLKQSIYRFRLAEPSLFAGRERTLGRSSRRGEVVPLRENFRSRGTIIEGVNVVFRALFGAARGLVRYDAAAELVPGTEAQEERGSPVGVVLLERDVSPPAAAPEDEERGDARAADDVADLETVEREAFVIAEEIQRLVAGEAGGEKFRYKDVAILLRSARHRAGRVASVLARLGVPAYTPAGTALFESLEVMDVLALLEAVDNPRQDVPLASALRSGLLGEPFSPDDLAHLRAFDRGVPFHEAVFSFARDGRDERLRARLARALARLDSWRSAARRRPLAEVIFEIYEETSCLAFAGGLDRGAERRANLLDLHERARQFGAFHRQGLHRFLRFVETLRSEERDLGAPPAIGEGEDVVRILTIHQSKGLEFPVVFVMDLGRRFNLEDSRGRILFDRESGLGLKTVDREKMIEYPSAAHRLVSRRSRAAALDEEIRVLYVAMTRAERRLHLVASVSLGRARARLFDERRPPTEIDVLSAESPADWVLAALGGTDGLERVFDVKTLGRDDLAGYGSRPAETGEERALREAVAALAPLPSVEPVAPAASEADDLLAALRTGYPYAAATRVRAVLAASAAKDRGAFDLDREERAPHSRRAALRAGGVDPAVTGTATHRFLERIDFARAGDAAGVAAEIERLVAERVLDSEEALAVDPAAIAWFFGESTLGREISAAGGRFRREVVFLSSEAARDVDPHLARDVEETVVVRGAIDGVLLRDDGLVVVDYKTDRVAPVEIEARAAAYEPVIRLYARAAERLFRRPVLSTSLVFLAARKTVPVAVSGHSS